MKICILTPRFPLPERAGDVLRINNIARYLKAQGHELVLVSLYDEKPDVNSAQKLYDKVYKLKRNNKKSYLFSMLYVLSGRPMQCGYYHSSAFTNLLREVQQKEKPDLYISHLLRMTPYLLKLGVVKQSIVEMTDALSKNYSLSAGAKGKGFIKFVYSIEKYLIKRFELKVAKAFPKVVLVSQKDIDYLQGLTKTPLTSLAMHTNGVECVETISSSYIPDKLCYIGNMRSLMNRDAALYFANDIFPLILKKKPSAKFYIVGAEAPEKIQSLACENIIVTGFIDDVQQFVSDACLVVAPVRIATGIQNKVLVAMGTGIPVVMNSLVATGIPEVVDGKNALVADTPQEFADKCVKLMENDSLRQTLAVKGYETVRNCYSWKEKLQGYLDS